MSWSERVAGYGDYLVAMLKVAQREKVPLFRRRLAAFPLRFRLGSFLNIAQAQP
jgi:hypothetical protein